MSRLRRLVLLNCPGSAGLLLYLSESAEVHSLEVTGGYDIDLDDDDYWRLEFEVPSFLRSFTGLQSLFLNLPTPNWRTIVASVGKHPETLKRIALHARCFNIDENSPYCGSEEDTALDFYPIFHDLLTNHFCEIITLPKSPSFMRECLQSYATDVTCNLLHLRASEEDMKRIDHEYYVSRDEVNDFAEWVLGSNGFPRLLVFAYGDFAFPISCQDYNVLYCRNDQKAEEEGGPNYKVLTSDNEVWEWVMTNKDVLSACPHKRINGP